MQFFRNSADAGGLGRLRIKIRKRVHVFLRVFKPMYFCMGLRVLRVMRNLRLFTRKTRNLPSTAIHTSVLIF